LGRLIEIPAPLLALFRGASGWTPRLGLVRYLRTFQVHAVRLSWLTAPELVRNNRLSKGLLFALVYHLLIELLSHVYF
jgi:hypothetical protein